MWKYLMLIAVCLSVTACDSAAEKEQSTPEPSDPRRVMAGPKGEAVLMREDLRGDRVTAAPFATRSTVLGVNGMAATSHPLASQVAIDILKKGGSAVDAAIAANAAIGLMEPTGNGIGGDLFAIVWDPKTQKLYGLNASGRAPKGQSLQDLKDKLKGKTDIPGWGTLPVTVPGTVSGWSELHQKFGSLPWKETLQPAISYARDGFPVTEVIAYYMGYSHKLYERKYKEGLLEEVENFRKTYLINGKPPVEGQLFKNPALATTLSIIADKGADAFYKGELALIMDAYFRRIGGALRLDDFASHTATWVTPVSINYRGYDVWELPPNGQGIAALQMLNILEGFDLKSMGFGTADSLHVMAEAKKLAFEDRARFYADPDFHKVNLNYLLSKDYAQQRRALISMDNNLKEVDHGDPKLIEGDTIYMTVADKNGMMVSLIQSNFRGMGSGLVPDGLGFVFQDRGEHFSLSEGHPNVYAPGKRPFHTIIPAFMTKDGKPLMSFGLMGGSMQPQGHAQIIVNLIDHGMTLQQAGDAARFNHMGSTSPQWKGRMKDGGKLYLESGFSAVAVRGLQAKGHIVVVRRSSLFGGYQAIWRDPDSGVYYGASEMRKDGIAIAY